MNYQDICHKHPTADRRGLAGKTAASTARRFISILEVSASGQDNHFLKAANIFVPQSSFHPGHLSEEFFCRWDCRAPGSEVKIDRVSKFLAGRYLSVIGSRRLLPLTLLKSPEAPQRPGRMFP